MHVSGILFVALLLQISVARRLQEDDGAPLHHSLVAREAGLLILVDGRGSKNFDLKFVRDRSFSTPDGVEVHAADFLTVDHVLGGGGSGAIAVSAVSSLEYLEGELIVKVDGKAGVYEHLALVKVAEELDKIGSQESKQIQSHIPKFVSMYVSGITGNCLPANTLAKTNRECAGWYVCNLKSEHYANSFEVCTASTDTSTELKVPIDEVPHLMYKLTQILENNRSYTLVQTPVGPPESKKAADFFVDAADNFDDISLDTMRRQLADGFIKQVDMLEKAKDVQPPSRKVFNQAIQSLRGGAGPSLEALFVNTFLADSILKNIARYEQLKIASTDFADFASGIVKTDKASAALEWAGDFSTLIRSAAEVEKKGLRNFGIKDGGLHNLLIDVTEAGNYDFYAFDLGPAADVAVGAFATKFLMSFFHILGMDKETPPLQAQNLNRTKDRLRGIFQTYLYVRDEIASYIMADSMQDQSKARRLLDRYVIMQLLSDSAQPCLKNFQSSSGTQRKMWSARARYDVTLAIALFQTLSPTQSEEVEALTGAFTNELDTLTREGE